MDESSPRLYFEVAMHRTLLCALAALASLSLFTSAAEAQGRAAFTNGYLEWGLRPDVPRVPYDGAPFSEKYIASNYLATPLMLGANPGQLWYMYYMDRVDRAERFGYALPGYDPEPPPNPPRHRRFGLFGR
jgi:hypothetical protein